MRQEHRDREAAPDTDLNELERQADEARRKLSDAERRAEETLDHAEHELRERTAEQEATAERLRRESREATGPLRPPAPQDDT